MTTVYLVDAAPYVFRAYYALPDTLVDREGHPVHAVYGFLDLLLSLLEDDTASGLAVAFDGSLRSSFRNELLPTYKSSRPEADEDLERQFGLCFDFCRALGLPTFVHERFEADDLVATLTERVLADSDEEVVVVTNDKDLAQLVDERVSWLDLARGERLGPDDVRRRLGVRPRQVPDYLGLAGDPVDDIPGVRGVGKKTACALLEVFEDLDALYADLDRVETLPLRGAAGVRRRLEAGRDAAFLSRRLATLVRDVPLSDDLGLTAAPPDRARLEALVDRLASTRLSARLRAHLGA